MNSTSFRMLLGAMSAVVLLASCDTVPENLMALPGSASHPMLFGDYRLITLRRASDVVGSVTDPTISSAEIGSAVSFGKTVKWFNKKTCANWEEVVGKTASVNLNDPNLVDLIISSDGGLLNADGQRKFSNIQILCDGAPLAVVTRIDERILVTSSPSGLSYAILERPLPPNEVRDLQFKLKALNFYYGGTTGEMDEATHDSISRYASHRGRYDLTFKRSALTENLLKGLGFHTSGKIDEVSDAKTGTSIKSRFPDYEPKLSEDGTLDYSPRLMARIDEIPVVSRQNFQNAYVALGDFNRDATGNPGGFEQGKVALGADPEEYAPSDEEMLAAELGDRLAALVQKMSAEEIMGAWDGAALLPPSIEYYRFEYRHVDVMGSGRFFYASKPNKVVINIPSQPSEE